MDDGLHEAHDPKGFQQGRLYSMLDIMFGATATCDSCGRWQRFGAITERDLAEMAKAAGWQVGEKDFCPICAPSSGSGREM